MRGCRARSGSLGASWVPEPCASYGQRPSCWEHHGLRPQRNGPAQASPPPCPSPPGGQQSPGPALPTAQPGPRALPFCPQHLPSLTFREHHHVGLGLLLPSQACVLRSQELHAEQGPFPWGLSSRAVSHEGRPQLPEVGQGRAWAGQPLHPVPFREQSKH